MKNKKFFALIFSLLFVGLIFVGCTKESDTYFYDVYDFWNEKVKATEIAEFYDPNVDISFDNENINKLIGDNKDFGEIKGYQTTLNNLKSDVQLLSFEFIHDPKLEGDARKNAQSKVSDYKEQLEEYADEIEQFNQAKKSFETTCATLDFEVAGIIEKDEYKVFLSEFRTLINSLNDVFSKMFDCASSMFYSGKVSDFKSNDERISAVKENYFETKILLTADYIYFCYNHSDSTQSSKDRATIATNYNTVKGLSLTSLMLEQTKNDATLAGIDSTLKTLHTWAQYYKSQSESIKSAMNAGEFKYNIDGLETNTLENAKIKQNYEKYSNLINSTMKNLSETCASLVAFY